MYGAQSSRHCERAPLYALVSVRLQVCRNLEVVLLSARQLTKLGPLCEYLYLRNTAGHHASLKGHENLRAVLHRTETAVNIYIYICIVYIYNMYIYIYTYIALSCHCHNKEAPSSERARLACFRQLLCYDLTVVLPSTLSRAADSGPEREREREGRDEGFRLAAWPVQCALVLPLLFVEPLAGQLVRSELFLVQVPSTSLCFSSSTQPCVGLGLLKRILKAFAALLMARPTISDASDSPTTNSLHFGCMYRPPGTVRNK